jgi:hypothetical protein
LAPLHPQPPASKRRRETRTQVSCRSERISPEGPRTRAEEPAITPGVALSRAATETWIASPGKSWGKRMLVPSRVSAPLSAAAPSSDSPCGSSASLAPRRGPLPVLAIPARRVRAAPGVSPPSALSVTRAAPAGACATTEITTAALAGEEAPSPAV